MSYSARLASLDGIRAVCIAMVLGGHAAVSPGFPESWRAPADYLFNGALGVRVFFVLSGYLITYLLLREAERTGRISLRDFYVRRALRILPVYYTFLGALAVLYAATGRDGSVPQWLASLTFTKDFGGSRPEDTHLWSLSVEEQFYLLWPSVVALAAPRWRWYVLGALIGLAPACRVACYLAGARYWLAFSFMTNMDALLFGCLAALLVTRDPAAARRFLARAPAAGRLMALAVLYGVCLAEQRGRFGRVLLPFGLTAQSAAAAYLIASYSIQQGGLGGWLLNRPALCYLGVLSYSIYIWQQPFFYCPDVLPEPAAWLLRFPLNVPAAVGCAALSYHCLEQPFLGLRSRFRHAEQAPPPTAELPAPAESLSAPSVPV